MKRFFVIILLVFFSLQTVFANIEEKDYSLKFNGTNYRLLYSVKNNDFGGYLNEYYRLGETYNIWSDMVAVHQRQLLSWEEDRQKVLTLEERCSKLEGQTDIQQHPSCTCL